MPRIKRFKLPGGIYHIMVRGISEISLFKTRKEKEKYLYYLKKYQIIFKFKVYAFCIMDTHAHVIIGSNGADISKFMHSINGCYVKWFNKINKRHGHALGDRFKSILITDDNYLITSSLYVHRNPVDIIEYQNKIEAYKYSSIHNYIEELWDEIPFVEVDTELILMHFGDDKTRAKDLYYSLFKEYCKDKKEGNKIKERFKDKNYYVSGKSLLVRNVDPINIIGFISSNLNINTFEIKVKYKRNASLLRSLSVLFMRCLCDFQINQISKVIGNITCSQVSYLCNRGYELITQKKEYSNLFANLINKFSLE